MTTSEEVAAASLRPALRSLRLWVVLALVIVAVALGVALSEPSSGRPLDPTSARGDGSRALSVLLAARGTSSRAVTAVDQAADAPGDSTVLVTSPDDFADAQLRQLVRSRHRLVFLDPSPQALAVVAAGRTARHVGPDYAPPDCAWPGAAAAGPADFSSESAAYSGEGACYGGRVVVTADLVLLGTRDLLVNDRLAHDHLAAVAMNALTADGTVSSIVWLLPGPDAAGPGAPSVWSLFPPWAARALWQLLLVALLVAVWRGRRLGPVVREPLPVIVRASEVVEGHGRLYLRARARDRAAAALRAGTTRRLATRLGLRSGAAASEVATLVADHDRRVLLDTDVPPDDRELVRLAVDLRRLERDNRANGATQ